ncbi:putative toxin-antitoxin system toxin component, PIN family [Geminocystis sp. CENA526]|uniref:putative toxin-antitoxin system toxin component, PIN family n=1 Tax=Geminocystis sp. CENA526 TaxID=1355871 RepID=UPI003D6E3065
MSNIRIVIDINIIVSALLFPNSKPDLALQKSLDIGDILISYSVWTELENVIVRPKFDRYISLEKRQKFLREFYQTVTIITNISETITDCRDPKDNKYLELAFIGKAKYLITGDNDLLVLNPFRGIEIIKPEEFLVNVN